MNKELLLDMYYAVPELWYIVLAVFVGLIGTIIFFYIRLLKLNRKKYFINRSQERYAETLNASKDGYFAFIYPDEGVNDAVKNVSERCSRRLAVMLGLPLGIDTSFAEVLKSFYKEDADKILKYSHLLREEGVSFEDKFELRNGKKIILNGVRINGVDGNLYSDIIWFRDISYVTLQVEKLEKEKEQAQKQELDYKDLVNNLPYPVWMRTPQMKLKLVNQKYSEYTEGKKENNDFELAGKELAEQARDTNKLQKKTIHLNKEGEHRCFEVIETPFHYEESLDKIATVGAMIDISDLDNLRRNIKQNQNAHLEILASLGTAIAVFDTSYKIIFYNKAFTQLWGIEESWFEEHSQYGAFLDYLSEKRLLPEVPNYPYYRAEEHKMFASIIEPREDLLHLPDGRSLRRIRAPHLKGGLIFAFEDITDRLTVRREYNSLLNVQQEILNNIKDAILIFGSDGKLQFYNKSYVKMWKVREDILQTGPTFAEILEMQKMFFNHVNNWDELKKDISNHVFSSKTEAFSLDRSDGMEVECISSLLSNESIMLLIHPNSQA